MMASHSLPQLRGDLFLTDGGIETTLIFADGLELTDFAAFPLLRDPSGREALMRYFRSYAEIARRFETGLILETATWRANADWGRRLGYSADELGTFNRDAIALLQAVRNEFASVPIVISGCIGPRGDGYIADLSMTERDAEEYHWPQVQAFAEGQADMICGLTMTYAEEAVGVARAAQRAGLPVAISFTVETDGRLPSGASLSSAIEHVDAATSRYPSYFMINCAHPTHFEHLLASSEPWMARLRGVRANASTKSHAELNESPTLDAGDPVALGVAFARLKKLQPQLNVMGGCCGTDHGHIELIARACLPHFRQLA